VKCVTWESEKLLYQQTLLLSHRDSLWLAENNVVMSKLQITREVADSGARSTACQRWCSLQPTNWEQCGNVSADYDWSHAIAVHVTGHYKHDTTLTSTNMPCVAGNDKRTVPLAQMRKLGEHFEFLIKEQHQNGMMWHVSVTESDSECRFGSVTWK